MAEQCPQCKRNDATAKISDLARTNKALVAPPKPRLAFGNGIGCAVLVISTVVSVVVAAVGGWLTAIAYGDYYRAAAALTPSETAANAAVLIFMVAFAVCFFLGFFVYQRRALTDLRDRIIAWQKVVARWQRSYHCRQCDAVFVSGEGRALPSAQLGDLIAATPDARPSASERPSAVAR